MTRTDVLHGWDLYDIVLEDSGTLELQCIGKKHSYQLCPVSYMPYSFFRSTIVMHLVKSLGSRITASLLTALVVMAALGAATADARNDAGGSRGPSGVSGCRRCRDSMIVRRAPVVMLSSGGVVQMSTLI